METSDKVADKCSSPFCHQLPFEMNEASKAAGHSSPQPAPPAPAAAGLPAKPLLPLQQWGSPPNPAAPSTGVSPLPPCSPAHSPGKEISVLPAVPCMGTVSVPGNFLVFIGILACLSIRITVNAAGSGRNLPVPSLPSGNPCTGISQARR